MKLVLQEGGEGSRTVSLSFIYRRKRREQSQVRPPSLASIKSILSAGGVALFSSAGSGKNHSGWRVSVAVTRVGVFSNVSLGRLG